MKVVENNFPNGGIKINQAIETKSIGLFWEFNTDCNRSINDWFLNWEKNDRKL